MTDLKVEICKVEEAQIHPNADRLEIIKIKGWSVIHSKGTLKIGDLVIYVPIDSVLPESITSKLPIKIEKGRVRTIRLRGFISQGLILEPKIWLPLVNPKILKEGLDVAKELGITKWEPPEPKGYINRGRMVKKRYLHPQFLKYTSIENIKNYPDVFEEGEEVVISEKLHGSNARFGNLPIYTKSPIMKLWYKITRQTYMFVYGSHNVQLTGKIRKKTWYGEDIYGKIAKKYDLANKIPKDMIIFGEIYGKGVQDLTYGLENIDVIFFDAYNTKENKYLDYDNLRILFINMDLPLIPWLFRGTFNKEVIKSFTIGNTAIGTNPSQLREGCIVKPVKERNNIKIGRAILKSISEEYLLRKDATEFH